MGRGYSWKNVGIIVYLDNEVEVLGQELVDKLIKFAEESGNKRWCEDWPIILNVKSSGYYDEGKYTGPWEDSYPEEGDDEREFVSMTFDMCDGKGTEIEVPNALGEEVFEKVFESHVMEAELELG